MKVRVFSISFLVIVMMLAFASVAMAQNQCSLVNVTPLSGNAGSTVYVSGETTADSTLWVMFDGTQIASINTDVGTGQFGKNVTIPADATAGDHTVQLLLPTEASCDFTFTVEAVTTTTPETPTTQAPATAAPAATPATLPSTGFFLIIPGAGLIAAGAGGLLYRRRKG